MVDKLLHGGATIDLQDNVNINNEGAIKYLITQRCISRGYMHAPCRLQ